MGLAIAILVDVTIVSALLVPTSMQLFGRLDWWAPRPLRALCTRWSVRA